MKPLQSILVIGLLILPYPSRGTRIPIPSLMSQHTGVMAGAIVRNENMGNSFKHIVLVLYIYTLHVLVICPVH